MIRQFAAVVLLCFPGMVSAQGPRHFSQTLGPPEATPTAWTPDPPAATGTVTGKAVLGASLGLVIGVVGGAFAGAALEDRDHCSDQCGLLGGIGGAAIGPTLTIPVGLHLADANRHVVESLAISAALGAVGVAVLEDRPAVVLAVPAARLVIALFAKR